MIVKNPYCTVKSWVWRLARFPLLHNSLTSSKCKPVPCLLKIPSLYTRHHCPTSLQALWPARGTSLSVCQCWVAVLKVYCRCFCRLAGESPGSLCYTGKSWKALQYHHCCHRHRHIPHACRGSLQASGSKCLWETADAIACGADAALRQGVWSGLVWSVVVVKLWHGLPLFPPHFEGNFVLTGREAMAMALLWSAYLYSGAMRCRAEKIQYMKYTTY